MIFSEALLLLLSLTSSNADIQKIVAFMGAFDRLFQIIEREGGLDGGIVTQDCLSCIGNLLRYNVSNQVSAIPICTPCFVFRDRVSSLPTTSELLPRNILHPLLRPTPPLPTISSDIDDDTRTGIARIANVGRVR